MNIEQVKVEMTELLLSKCLTKTECEGSCAECLVDQLVNAGYRKVQNPEEIVTAQTKGELIQNTVKEVLLALVKYFDKHVDSTGDVTKMAMKLRVVGFIKDMCKIYKVELYDVDEEDAKAGDVDG